MGQGVLIKNSSIKTINFNNNSVNK